MAKIKQVTARQILNSKGVPTIETTVILSDGASGVASSPSGTSTGKYEALDLKDKNEKEFQGLTVHNAVLNVENIIGPSILGMDAFKQPDIDKKMISTDGTHNKARLGANAILSVSVAVAKAASKSSVLPLFVYLREFVKKENISPKIPTPLFNILNGGKHAQGASLDFQEFLIIPATSKSYSECLAIGSTIYFALKKTLEVNNLSILVADEGGFSPQVATNQDGLLSLKQAIESSNLRIGFDVFLGIDAAANNLLSEGKYHIKDKTIAMESKDLISFYQTLNNDFHFLYLEDGLAEDDWEGWAQLCTLMSKETLIVADDLTVTNPYRLQLALNKNALTGIVIKPNQIGTVIEALAVAEIARESGLKTIVSARSGETNDDFIADFAVAVSADYCKFGAPVRGERVAKYNRLLQIERQIKSL